MDILLHYSKFITILTGAGVSTGVGIPDFRGKGKDTSFDREKCVNFLPGIEHDYISEMVNKGYVKYVITQNIDDLHRDIEKDRLIELHGNVKSTIVEFGCELDIKKWTKTMDIIKNTDLLIIIGTSLSVYPVNTIPLIMLKKCDNIVIINNDPTDIDDYARIIYRDDIKDVLKDMIGIFRGETAQIKPYKMNEFNTHINTVKEWVCDKCTFKNRFLTCELCGYGFE